MTEQAVAQQQCKEGRERNSDRCSGKSIVGKQRRWRHSAGIATQWLHKILRMKRLHIKENLSKGILPNLIANISNYFTCLTVGN